jgi:cytochrome P450
MRLYPVTPLLPPRKANKDTILPHGGGPDGKSPLFVPKGTGLVVNIHCGNRRKEIYGQDAEEFRPERWEDLRPGWVCDFFQFPFVPYLESFSFFFFFLMKKGFPN